MLDFSLPLLKLNWWCIIFLMENSGMQNFTLNLCVVQYGPVDLIYSTLLYWILRSSFLVCFILIVLSVAPLPHRYVNPETIFDLCFLPPLSLSFTTGGCSLFPLDKLNILSNFGSFSMASLCWFLFVFVLSFTTWYNLFIFLCSVDFLSYSRSLSLDREES